MSYRRAFTLVELIVMLVIIAGLTALLWPAVRAAKETSRPPNCTTNLKMLAIAMHNYFDTYDSLPPAYVADEEGTPLYSWRVLLLPFLEQEPLYNRFHLDEPWDSEHNRQLLPEGPAVFACPPRNRRLAEKWYSMGHEYSSYAMIVGPNALSEGSNATEFRNITDGLSNTLFFVETRKKIPWSAPVDIPLQALDHGVTKPGGPDESIGSLHKDGAHVALADGSIRFVPVDVKPDTLKRFAVINDGKPVDWDE